MKKRILLLGWLGVFSLLAFQAEGAMNITSPEFVHNGHIPRRFTCQGDDINPALKISEVPAGAKSLALVVDDPDAPMGTWVHWVVFNLSPTTTSIPQKSVPGTQGVNDFRRLDYGGPCPPSGTHRYFFKIYALDSLLNLREGVSKRDLEHAMQGHILAKSELVGLYQKEK